jgi:prepilin-type N-terminal cleavage/methylation domain-containing protein
MHSKQNGFTLVELAIVMIIIGLLIGGVLKGQELISNAKTTAVISEVKGYLAALNTFQDTYGGMPGDMNNATSRISGCGGPTATGNFCENSNGNSLVGGTGNAGNSGIIFAWEAGALTVSDEPAQFFKHLALADLITVVNPSTNTQAWGEIFPSSSLRGGYTFVMTRCTTSSYGNSVGLQCDASPGGHLLRLHNSFNSGEGAYGSAPASSLETSRIDAKLDDSRPNTGSVRSTSGGNGVDVAHCEREYDGSKDKDCAIHFLING